MEQQQQKSIATKYEHPNEIGFGKPLAEMGWEGVKRKI